MLDEQQFFTMLQRESPPLSTRYAFADWLSARGEDDKANYVRHRAAMMRLAFETKLYQFHADEVEDLKRAISEDWRSNFRTDLTPHEKLSLSCCPRWAGAVRHLDADVLTLQIADQLSVYFDAMRVHQVITNSLLQRWEMPFEYIVSHTVKLWSDELQNWSLFDSPDRDRVYLSNDCGDDGSWAIWFYAPPAMWEGLEDETDGQVTLTGSPVLMPLDANRMLLTSENDRRGLEQMACAVVDLLGDTVAITKRPLRYDPEKNWAFLTDEENAAADVWLSHFGPNEHSPLESRALRKPLEVISDPAEREAAKELISRYPTGNRIEVLTLSGQRGDWRQGERQESVAIPVMKSLPHLQELRIWYAKLTKHWWNMLDECELPRLVSLILDHCRYDGNSVDAIANFPSIECLQLNQLGDDGLRAIANLPLLRELNISGTSISNDGLAYLRQSGMEFLDVSNCRLTDDTAKTLSTLKELRTLNLQNTGVTEKTIEKLVSLRKLTYIDLRGTCVTDDAVFSLSQIESLKKVDGISGPAMITLMDELPNFGTRRS